MPIEITVPRLGWSMDEGVFVEWSKKAGEFVQAGEVVFVLEGEKAVHEIESLDSGILCIPGDAPKEGDAVLVGQVIGFLLADGESPPTSVGSAPTKAAASPLSSPSAAGTPIASEPTTPEAPPMYFSNPSAAASEKPSAHARHVATPRARRRASELGIRLTRLRGTGRDGRIRERDVLRAKAPADKVASAPESPPIAPGQHSPASKMRLSIAQRMSVTVQQVAPVTLMTKVNASALVALRGRLKAESSAGAAPSYNDLIIKLVAATLCEIPQLNACWFNNGIWTYEVINIGMAVDTEAGLLAPVIRDADRLTITEIAERSRQMIERARAGKLTQDDLQGGTFTVSNLGMFGIDGFTPIINLPQAGILGVGRIVQEPIVRDGRIEIGESMTLSLTFDHRVVDGVPAARWLQRLTQSMERPDSILEISPV